MGLFAESGEDGACEQGGEEAEGHGPHSVDEIGFDGDMYTLSFKKMFDACGFHVRISFLIPDIVWGYTHI